MPDIKKCPVFRDYLGFLLLNFPIRNLQAKINGNKFQPNFNKSMKNILKLMKKEVSESLKINNHL